MAGVSPRHGRPFSARRDRRAGLRHHRGLTARGPRLATSRPPSGENPIYRYGRYPADAARPLATWVPSRMRSALPGATATPDRHSRSHRLWLGRHRPHDRGGNAAAFAPISGASACGGGCRAGPARASVGAPPGFGIEELRAAPRGIETDTPWGRPDTRWRRSAEIRLPRALATMKVFEPVGSMVTIRAGKPAAPSVATRCSGRTPRAVGCPGAARPPDSRAMRSPSSATKTAPSAAGSTVRRSGSSTASR